MAVTEISIKGKSTLELHFILILQHLKPSHARDKSILPVSLRGCGAPGRGVKEPSIKKFTIKPAPTNTHLRQARRALRRRAG